MRRTRFASFLLFLAAATGCSEVREASLLDAVVDSEGLPATTPSKNVYDGTSGADGANPHFFFFNPIAETTPPYAGVADDSLEPVVTVCPVDAWNAAIDECPQGQETAVFTVDATNPDDQIIVDPGLKYGVVWQTKDHPAQEGVSYRIAVSVVGKLLGYADVMAFNQSVYSGHHNTQEGVIAFSNNGSINISFRIEDGALESEFCDASSVEDCDVALFTYGEAGCLRVYENPGQTGELLGSQACVPANAAQVNNEPVEGTYAVILTLEEQEQFQSGDVPPGQQIPYFPDLYTDPPGITFDTDSDGIQVAICQIVEGPDAVDETLHPFLRPFIVYADGTTVLPENYSYGVPECDGFGAPHSHTVAGGPGSSESIGLLSRLAKGAVAVGKYFLPEPLVARRLHGGLNTTVYDTRGSTDGEGGTENVAPFALGEEPQIAEFGAVLDVDPLNSEANVPTGGQVGVENTITILALDPEGLPFPFQVPVVAEATSGSDVIAGVVSYEGSGLYTATYTPTTVGTDQVTITIDGDPMAGSPFEIPIIPRDVDASGSTFEVSYSEAGSSTTVTVEVKDSNGDLYVYGENFGVDVVIEVTGANTASVPAVDDDGTGTYDGIYVASYTPETYGDDEITVTVNGEPTGDSPFTVTTAPRPADPGQSSALVESTAEVTGGLVDSPTNVTITVLNEGGEPYDYADIRPIVVEFSVSGANTVAAITLSDPEGDGVYTTTYTPTSAGTDFIAVTIDGTPIAGSPFTSEVAPLSGDLVVDVNITGGAPEDGLPVILYPDADPSSPMTGTTDANGQVLFVDIDFGGYTVHLPKRDFDMAFTDMTVAFTHDEAPNSITLSATTLPLPEGSRVWRVKTGGNGNAYQYIVDGRSFGASLNQISAMPPLHGVQPHIVDILSEEENIFVKDFFVLDPGLCPDETNPKKCKYQGWIGLTDEAVEGTYVWVTTGAEATYFSWPDGVEPEDRKGNLDQVEIDLLGDWGIINGASSTNEGYFVEWEVAWPGTPPF